MLINLWASPALSSWALRLCRIDRWKLKLLHRALTLHICSLNFDINTKLDNVINLQFSIKPAIDDNLSPFRV